MIVILFKAWALKITTSITELDKTSPEGIHIVTDDVRYSPHMEGAENVLSLGKALQKETPEAQNISI